MYYNVLIPQSEIILIIVLWFLLSPVDVSAAVLLTLGWSLSSSSKNSVVPPVSLATPCRSLLQARGPRPRPKHLQRWYSSMYITFLLHPLRKLNYDTTIFMWALSSLSAITEWSLMHCLNYTDNVFFHFTQINNQQPLATTQTYVNIYLWNPNGTQRLPCV